MSLDELFVQILQSEQKAQARRTFLTKIKNETSQIQQMIKELVEETEALKGHLAIKYQVLADEELKRKWLSSKERILQEQFQQLVSTRNTLEKYLKEAKEFQGSKTFMAEVKVFCKRYDLCGNGKSLRRDETQEKMKKLVQEEVLLEKELADFKAHEERVQCLEEDKCLLEMELNETKQKIQDLDSQIYREQAAITALEEEKGNVAKKQQTDPEFQRLQMELEACKADTMEDMCEAYRLELQQLQQKQWQKQLNKSLKQAHSGERQKLNKRQTMPGRSAHINPYKREQHTVDTDAHLYPQDESKRKLGEKDKTQQSLATRISSRTNQHRSSRMLSSAYLPPRAKKVHFKK